MLTSGCKPRLLTKPASPWSSAAVNSDVGTPASAAAIILTSTRTAEVAPALLQAVALAKSCDAWQQGQLKGQTCLKAEAKGFDALLLAAELS